MRSRTAGRRELLLIRKGFLYWLVSTGRSKVGVTGADAVSVVVSQITGWIPLRTQSLKTGSSRYYIIQNHRDQKIWKAAEQNRY